MLQITAEDWDVYGRTVWGEARGEPFSGQVAVAWVIRNRVNSGRWGQTYEAVCMFPKQFSCWNEGDPNRAKALTVNANDPTFLRAKGITALVAWGDLPDPTQGATHYYAQFIPEPSWAKDMVTTTVVAHHRFMREANQ